MLQFSLHETVDEVPAACWALPDDAVCGLYRTAAWLRDSQWRLGDSQLFVSASDGASALALFPIILADRPTGYPRFDPATYLATTGRPWPGRIAMCTSIFGSGHAMRYADSTILRVPLVADLATFLRDQVGCRSLLFLHHFTEHEPLSGLRGLRTVPSGGVGILPIAESDGYEAYLSSLRYKARQNHRTEVRKASDNGICLVSKPLSWFDPDQLDRLGRNVYAKYGIDVPAGRVASFLQYFDREFSGKSILVAALKDNQLLCYVHAIEHGVGLHLKNLGRDYSADIYGAYFPTAFHATVRLAAERHLRYIEFGAGADMTKSIRGVQMRPLQSHFLDLS
jgi:hypothetical protein